MLSRADSELLMRVTDDAPMGQLVRRPRCSLDRSTMLPMLSPRASEGFPSSSLRTTSRSCRRILITVMSEVLGQPWRTVGRSGQSVDSAPQTSPNLRVSSGANQ